MDRGAFFWRVQHGELPVPPAAATLGLTVRAIDADAGTIEVAFVATPAFLNPAGQVQGGFLAAMLDDTMGPALAATLAAGEFAPTLNLNVCFERPARTGELLGRGRVLRKGREACVLSAELLQEGKRVASATATALIRRAVPDQR